MTSVDLIMLSKASTPSLERMTNTAIYSSGLRPIVIEQERGVTYPAAHTVYYADDRPFNYNQLMNYGASLGTADWVVFANNDLLFDRDWLQPLLDADHPFVSPKSPTDIRQIDVQSNLVGDVTGRHMSGWCFMLARELYTAIGGLDEVCNFWCSDDVVIEQTRAKGVLPMLVPASKVHHLGSKTLNTVENHDELTWADLRRYTAKYGPHRLSGEKDYLDWLARTDTV